MDAMHEESYVVRIYRRDSAVIGVVEAVPTGWQKPFRNLQELADILASPGGHREAGVRGSVGLGGEGT